MARRRCHGDGRDDVFGITHGPFQHLHSPHGPAQGAQQPRHAEMVEQGSLGLDHVADGHHGKIQAPGIAGPLRILRARAAAAHAPAEHVGADHKIAIGIDRAPGTDHDVPPARPVVLGRGEPGDMRVAGQGVQDEHGVVSRLRERAIGLVRKGDRRQGGTAFQLHGRPVQPQVLPLHQTDPRSRGVVLGIFAHVFNLRQAQSPRKPGQAPHFRFRETPRREKTRAVDQVKLDGPDAARLPGPGRRLDMTRQKGIFY